MAKSIRRRKKNKLSKPELIRRREDRKFKRDINTIFINSGFIQIPTRNQGVVIAKRQGEIDNVFIYENIIVLVEDTTTKNNDDLKDHILKTIDFYEHIKKNSSDFISVLETKFPRFKALRTGKYLDTEYKFIFVYSSLNAVDQKYQNRYTELRFFNYTCLQYFLRLSKTIGKTTRFELFKFLGLSLNDIGNQKSGNDSRTYEGFVLPESPSGFPEGYKLVTFLIEPQGLMEQCYVLRKDGWRDIEFLYQRLLIRSKIVNMREYLTTKKRVFINNIIVTLPGDTEIRSIKDNKVISHKDLNKRENVKICIKKELNTIGIIDGQHRVFTYHEGQDRADKVIALLRDKQHLLLTGIIYPEDMKDEDKIKFEAKLFLEINDKQSRARGDLKQAIEALINPYSSTAIAKRVVTNLGQTGPLTGYLEEHFYDSKKIKTTSIVSYAMKHIVSLEGAGTLFLKWQNKDKESLVHQRNRDILNEYIEFCTNEIIKFISAFKEVTASELWTLDKKKSAALRTTTINGLIFCIKRLLENDRLSSFEEYKKKLAKLQLNLNPSKFKYKSSHWKDLGDDIYKQCFS